MTAPDTAAILTAFQGAFSQLETILRTQAEDLQMLTVEDCMDALKKSRSTIYQMCHDGRLAMIDERIPRKVVKDYVDGKRQIKQKRRNGRCP
jgi:hypothetical protein